MPCSRFFLLAMAASVALCGCVSGPYQQGQGWKSAAATPKATPPCADVTCTAEPCEALHIEQGRPYPVIDGVGWVVGIPSKLLLWDRRVNNHHVSEQTVDHVAGYLAENQLQDVCVRVNQYHPGDEWRRLTENRQVGAGWRYTLGTLSLVHYTIIPGRIFGGDYYNPYTNSLYVYSDVTSLALEKAAYSKDVHNRTYPGTYAAVNELPVVGLWHETIATNDAMSYVTHRGNESDVAEAKRILHPNYGATVGGAADHLVGVGPVLQIGGAIVGHVTGRTGSNQPTADGAVELVQPSATPTTQVATLPEELPVVQAQFME